LNLLYLLGEAQFSQRKQFQTIYLKKSSETIR